MPPKAASTIKPTVKSSTPNGTKQFIQKHYATRSASKMPPAAPSSAADASLLQKVHYLILGLTNKLDNRMDELSLDVQNIKLGQEKFAATIEEVKEIRENLDSNAATWDGERQALRAEIDLLKDKDDRRERLEIQHNITISGLQCSSNDVTSVVKNLLRDKFHIDAGSSVARIIPGRDNHKGDLVIVKLDGLATKKQILENKSCLMGTKIYINADRTTCDREIQGKVAAIAKEERLKGKVVKIGFKKLLIDGEPFIWRRDRVLYPPPTAREKVNSRPLRLDLHHSLPAGPSRATAPSIRPPTPSTRASGNTSPRTSPSRTF